MDSYDPFEEMHNFYKLDDPTEDEQFRFVEAMKYLIDTAVFEDDIIAFSYNLAMYYRDIKNFNLAKKYFEIGVEHGSSLSREELGYLYYYGIDHQVDFEKAFKLFEQCDTRRALYMIADMYHYGQYVERDIYKCRRILEKLYEDVLSERDDERFTISTLYPEIALRMAALNFEQECNNRDDLESLLYGRLILSYRQSKRAFWGNLKTMRDILELTIDLVGAELDFEDIYDLMTLDIDKANVVFNFENVFYEISVSKDNDGRLYQFGGKYYRGADGFLEKARIDGKRITTIYDQISDIRIIKE